MPVLAAPQQEHLGVTSTNFKLYKQPELRESIPRQKDMSLRIDQLRKVGFEPRNTAFIFN